MAQLIDNDERLPALTDKISFGPDTIEKMSRAFEEACITLQVFAGDEKGGR
jgi:hypothetical protein